MTVSHMFVNRKQIDAGPTLQLHARTQANPQPDDKITLGYNPKDAGF